MAEGKGPLGKILLGCGALLVLSLLAGIAVAVGLALRSSPSLAETGWVEVEFRVDLDEAVAQRPDRPEDEVREEAMAQTVEVVRRRLDEMDVRDPVVFREGDDRVVVQVVGYVDPDLLAAALTQQARLEFRFADEQRTAAELERAVDLVIQEAGLDAAASEELIEAAAGDLIPADHELLWEWERDAAGARTRTRPWIVEQRVGLTGSNVAGARAQQDQFGGATVSLQFDEAGTERFCELTRARTGEKLAIVLDGEVLGVPVIQEPICGGSASIAMGIGDPAEMSQAAKDLALNLRAGALPAPLEVETTSVIGPAE